MAGSHLEALFMLADGRHCRARVTAVEAEQILLSDGTLVSARDILSILIDHVITIPAE